MHVRIQGKGSGVCVCVLGVTHRVRERGQRVFRDASRWVALIAWAVADGNGCRGRDWLGKKVVQCALMGRVEGEGPA
jgi:hypothetical protein